MEIVLVISLVLIALGELVFIAWRDNAHRKQIDDLTSKIVAKSLGEYNAGKGTVTIPEKKEKVQPLVDPVMGAQGRNW
jgi:hypothetical protein